MMIRGNTNPIAYYDAIEFEENYFPFLIIPELYKSVLEKLYKSSPRDYKKFFISNHYIKSKAFKYVYYIYMSILDASIHAYEYQYHIKNKTNHAKYDYHALDKIDITKTSFQLSPNDYVFYDEVNDGFVHFTKDEKVEETVVNLNLKEATKVDDKIILTIEVLDGVLGTVNNTYKYTFEQDGENYYLITKELVAS